MTVAKLVSSRAPIGQIGIGAAQVVKVVKKDGDECTITLVGNSTVDVRGTLDAVVAALNGEQGA
jgi:hypothetical protein